MGHTRRGDPPVVAHVRENVVALVFVASFIPLLIQHKSVIALVFVASFIPLLIIMFIAWDMCIGMTDICIGMTDMCIGMTGIQNVNNG